MGFRKGMLDLFTERREKKLNGLKAVMGSPLFYLGESFTIIFQQMGHYIEHIIWDEIISAWIDDLWFDIITLSEMTEVLRHSGGSEVDELADPPVGGDAIFQEIFEDNDTGWMSLCFIP